MIKLKKNLLALFFVLLILVSGCSGKKDVKKSLEEIRTGTEGISVSFLPNNPPSTIHVAGTDTETVFDVVLELRNRGAYPQPDEDRKQQVKIYISGYDNNLMKIDVIPDDVTRLITSLEGKSNVNVIGGTDIVTFKGKVTAANLKVEKYEPTLLATVCYRYFTTAGPSVCIDPDPYSTLSQKKVCEVNDISLSDQGAPIAVTRIDEEAFQDKTQFKISIKNVGNGDVIKKESITDKCDPLATAANKIGRDDVDKVSLEGVTIGDIELDCSPFADGSVKSKKGTMRIINGEAYIVCELNKADYEAYRSSRTSFTTPLKIRLEYGYRTTAQRSLQIKKEISSASS